MIDLDNLGRRRLSLPDRRETDDYIERWERDERGRPVQIWTDKRSAEPVQRPSRDEKAERTFNRAVAFGYPVVIALAISTGSEDVGAFVAIVSGVTLMPIVWCVCVADLIRAACRGPAQGEER